MASGQQVPGINLTPEQAANALTMLEGGGFDFQFDSQGRITRITSGKMDRQQQAAQKRAQQERVSSDLVTQDIRRALQLVENATLPTTGAVGSLLSKLPGTASANLNALLTTVKANIGFDRLQRMRESSPTGGALGQVSDRERVALEATLGNLEQSQTKEQVLFNLVRIHNQILDTVHGQGQGPARLPVPGQAVPTVPAQPTAPAPGAPSNDPLGIR